MNKYIDMLQEYVDFDSVVELLKFDATNPLLFNTGLFLLLFSGFFAIYQLLRRWKTAKFIFVILFSLYFYYKSSAEYCLILLGVCVSDYILGLLLDRSSGSFWRRFIVFINVSVNVGMLVYFKYLNLILDTIANFSAVKFDTLDIILPAGISFFTFRSISYIVDIYRGKMSACRNFLVYTYYLTFFPPLLAGPVVRAKDMLPQVVANKAASKTMVSEGLVLIMCGLIKKVVVADYISQNFVDRVFDNPALYSGFENLVGIYGFTIQLYCDFSGYSDMAIGLALLMGYRFLDNFRSPFKSQSPTEFWHRWHISLSSWLRDYVYIPMGGNRCGVIRHHFNLMSTMLIGGLWHGASWMYIIWGGLQGLFLVGHKMLKSVLPGLSEKQRKSRWRVAFNVFVTFNLVAISFMFFRARSLDAVRDMTTQIYSNFHVDVAPQFIEGYMMIVLAILFGYIMHFLPSRWNDRLKARFHLLPILVQAFIVAVVILLIIQVRSSDIVPFIYLQY